MSERITEVRISTSLDDVEEWDSGALYVDSTDLELVDDGSWRPDQTVGLRFGGLDIPHGAEISAAYVQFTVDETDSGRSTFLIRGEDADNAAAFVDRAFNVSSRQLTDASVEWSPSAWTTEGTAGTAQQTADISSILQEIVNRDGWDALNSLALVITGDGERTAVSYDGDSSAAPLLHVEWSPPPDGRMVTEVRISSSADDVEERNTGALYVDSTDLELVDDGSWRPDQTVGLRFGGLDIPHGAEISAAYVQFTVDETDSGRSTFLIRGEDADNAASFVDRAFNVSSRQLTDASVEWSPSAWTTEGTAGTAQQTADISSILQEIVNRDGWDALNSLALVITGDGERTAVSYDGDSSAAPLLHVEWSLPGTGTLPLPTERPDTTAPSVSLDLALNGEDVSGTFSLSAMASDNVAIRDVQFRIDSEDLGFADRTEPYSFEVDTTEFSDGTVTFSAVATDTSGNQTVSAPLTVTIDNSIDVVAPPTQTPSGIIRVPEDHATLQDAVDAAGDGDTVLVGPGTYDGGIVVSGKSITIASHYSTTNDPSFIDSTIINGGSPAIYVDDSAPNTVIQGFHFVRGSKSVQFFGEGGQALDNFFDRTGSDAVSFEDVGGVARGNRFFGPTDDAIDVDFPTGDVLIEDNIIQWASDDGIEIRNGDYSGPLVSITIRNNTIIGSDEDGIQIIDYSGNANREFLIERNLIQGSKDAGIGLMDDGETVEDFRAASMPERIYVINNTIDDNSHGISGGDNLIALNNIVSNSSVVGFKRVDGESIVADTLFFGNARDHVGSNVDSGSTKTADPRFTDTFELEINSPAVDAGRVDYSYNGELVLNIPESEYNGSSVDLGWFEL